MKKEYQPEEILMNANFFLLFMQQLITMIFLNLMPLASGGHKDLNIYGLKIVS